MISVNDLFFSEQNSKRKKLENIVLKITPYTTQNLFSFAAVNTFMSVLKTLIILAGEVDIKYPRKVKKVKNNPRKEKMSKHSK